MNNDHPSKRFMAAWTVGSFAVMYALVSIPPIGAWFA